MSTVFPTIPERVANGIARLDENLPGWAWDIDLDRLNLRSPCGCILGQLFADDVADLDTATAYDYGLIALDIPARVAAGAQHGFDSAWSDDEFGPLTAEWKRRILARREAVRP